MLRTIIYAILLGVCMAACLSQKDRNSEVTGAEGISALGTEVADEEQATPSAENFEIRMGRVGSVSTTMPIEQVRQSKLPGFSITDTTLHLEGQPSTAYVLRARGANKGILVEQLCKKECEVWRIQVQHPDFKTPEGIGVGATFSEVKKAYPIKYISAGEGELVAVAEQARLSFILDDKQLPKEGLAQLKPADIPANARVKRILVY